MNTRRLRAELSDRRRWERGAAAMLVAVLLGGGVLIGVSALALDVGSIWWERRQVQNGADAASLALAGACGSAASNCNPNSAVISKFANANASDGASSNDGVCIRFTTTGMPSGWTTCPSKTDTTTIQAEKAANLGECMPIPDWLRNDSGINYLEVKVGTGSGTTKTRLPGIFSKLVTGQNNPHVGSCARAAWGPIGGASSLPLTFAKCEWQGATNPPKGGYGPAYETALPLKYDDKKKSSSCALSVPSGGDFDGGFGWLSTAVGCSATVNANSWVDAQPGIGGGSSCYDQFKPGTEVFLPIFDCVSDSNTGNAKPCVMGSPSGTHTWYHIDGFAKFFVSGINITKDGSGDFPLTGLPGNTAQQECKAESLDNKCIYGWFLNEYIPAAQFLNSSAGNYGAPGVLPAG